ncbi:MAG: MFS transporter [Beijerinckiaceae bacterium]
MGVSDIRYRLLIPFLLHSALFQVVTALTRVTVSYRSIELDLPVAWYGAISSGYALLPIFVALPLGRWIDRGRDAQAIWAGSAFTVAANLGLWIAPNSPWQLLAFTVVGGIGHLFLMAGHQMFVLRCAGPVGREAVLGHYMVALAIGQMIGPLIVGSAAGSAAVAPTGPLFALALGLAAATLAGAFAMPAMKAESGAAKRPAAATLGELVRVRGLIVVILASVMTVASMDLFMIYMPLLGAERGIGAWHVGMLLTTRAVASIASRIFYARMIAALGRANLTLLSMAGGAAGFAILAMPAPLPVMYAAVACMGFGLGLAVVLCLSNVVELAPPNARGLAMTMRLTGNRMGQFVFPFLAGLLGAAAGVAAILGVTSVAVLASAVATWRSIARRKAS